MMPAEHLKDLDCAVCNAEPAVGVASVPGMPLSVAYGRLCLDAGASPLWAVVANTACIGGMEHAADWWKVEVENTLRHLGVTEEDFNTQVATAIREDMETMGASDPRTQED